VEQPGIGPPASHPRPSLDALLGRYAIFIHLPDAQDGPTVGCTTVPRAALLEILGWLDGGAHPLLLQLPVGQAG